MLEKWAIAALQNVASALDEKKLTLIPKEIKITTYITFKRI